MKIPYTILSLLIGLTFLSGCCSTCIYGGSRHIAVLNEPITQKSLASVHVNAPDQRHELNAHGQRLYVSWNLSKEYADQELKGVLKVRFHVPEQIEVPFEINKLSGHMTYEIINEEYFAKEGILAYKVILYSNNEEIDTHQHKMWTELISFEE